MAALAVSWERKERIWLGQMEAEIVISWLLRKEVPGLLKYGPILLSMKERAQSGFE